MAKPTLSDAEIKMLPFLSFTQLVQEFDDEVDDEEYSDPVLAKIQGRQKAQGEWTPGTAVLDMSRVVSFSEVLLEELNENAVEVNLEGGHFHTLRISLAAFTAKLVAFRRIREVTIQASLLFSAS